ncbi:ABC transporter permease [Lichenicola cladoniae]|uniref:Autoinducer 2 import system permease protein LsrD n=1 Tax=Lichenicola cladoniae TaxID=1484109 RepID=A0A6M8HSE1_9PROT|nr:ABC transporter permease [Lichenicola cladoniae]NPD65711.1 ABC transporter permease [Acetobacteraceae bacterium]QKE91268.1 ABC transporter permease [Lichenicola cladoniae]
MTRGERAATALRRFATWESCLGALTSLFILAAVATVPRFATGFNISQAIAGISEKALIVLPMALLMITREIDLSVASILALSSVVLGVLLQAGIGLALAIPIVLLAGTACGVVNGLLVTRLGLSSLLVTLGTMAFYRGLGYVLLGADSVNELPDALTDFGIGNFLVGAIPQTIVPFLLLAPVFMLVLSATAIGRRIYAVGGSPDVALYSGIAIGRLKLGLFALSGLMCAIAGIVFTARLSNARADNAQGFELEIITMALLGGINVFGGRGRLTGVIWAALLLATLRNVLGLEGIGGEAQGISIGLLLILSLLLNGLVESRLARLRARRRAPAPQAGAASPA